MKAQARSSGGERYLDAVEVWGSNPHVPTIFLFQFILSVKSEV